MSFDSFNLHQRVLANIPYQTPSPIQQQSIPAVMAGRDVMGLAQTGTGKTAAFSLPIIHHLLSGTRGHVRALIVAPTRELAQQIHDTFETFTKGTGLRSVTLYGGVSINPQISALQRGVDIVVACPGRLLDHVEQKTIDLSKVEMLVLDEADQMFDMGFLPSIRRLKRYIPKQRQTLLFSATMPAAINELAYEFLTDPTVIKIGHVAPATSVTQTLYPVAAHLKTALLVEILKRTEIDSVLVFTRTKHGAKNVARKLESAGFKATSLQGNLSQNKRQSAMNGFRDGSIQVLVATDIASRGIDVNGISHVINYDMPETVEAYIHRIGRTGRADKVGEAFTLITNENHSEVRNIERVLGKKLEQRQLQDFNYNAAAPSRGTIGQITGGRMQNENNRRWHRSDDRRDR